MANAKHPASRRGIPQGRNCRRKSRLAWTVLAVAPVAAALWAVPSSGQTLTWDASGNTPGAPTDGGGFWDVSNSLSNPDTNWANGATDAAWTSDDVAQFGTNSGSAAGTVTIDDSSGTVTSAGLNFNAVASGNYTIAAISGDSLALTGTAALPAAITVAAGFSPTISAPISGSNGLTLAGTGTLNLAGANTYGGSTVLNSGTLNLNSGGTLGATSAGVVMGIIGAAPGGSPTPLTAVSTLNLNTSATVSSLTVNTNNSSTASNTLTIGSGQTLSVQGAVTIDLNPKTGTGVTHSNLAISGLGTFNATNSSNATFAVGTGENDSSNPPTAAETDATLDMSGLANFVFSTGSGEFDVGNGAHGQGTVNLANVSNSITAATVRVGDSTDGTASGNAGGASTLSLGAGTNVIDADTIRVGAIKDTGTLNFLMGTGSLTINNEAGTGGAALDIAMGVSGSSGTTGTVNLDGHAVNLNLGGMNVGNCDTNSTADVGATGVFSFDDGTVNATGITLAHTQGTSTTVARFSIGTLNIGSADDANIATFNVDVGGAAASQNIANASSGSLATSTGVINVLQGGIANINGALVTDAIAGNTATATVTVAGGTLNLMSHSIGNSITLITTGGELENITTIDTSGGVTMNTSGNTLILDGTNAWTGGTTISAGTVQVGQASDVAALTSPLGTSASAVSDGTTLNFASSQATTVSNTINGVGVVNQNGTGATTLSAAAGNSYGGGTTVNTGTLVATNTSGSATGTGNVTLNGGVLASGTTGSISGNVLAGTGAHTVAPGGVGTVGSLTIGGLTSTNLTTLNFDLGTGVGEITNGDLLTLGSGTVSIGSGTAMTFGGLPVAGDDYRLIGDLSSGAVVDAIPLANFSLPAAPAGLVYSLSNSVDAGYIDLVVVTSGPANLTWNNAGGASPSDGQTWDIGINNNWNNGTSTTVYSDGANVTFNDVNNAVSNGGSNANAYNVALNTIVAPASVLVNNSLGNYTISGTGTIGGTGSLTKSGTGTLTLSTPNTYSGGTTVTAGKLLIEPTSPTTSALPTGALTVTGGTVQLADNVTAGTALGTSNVNLTSLSITGTGTLDIGNNRIIIDYGSPATDPIASIAAWIKNGFYDLSGPQIISSDIAADDAASGLSYGIGYADGADGAVAGLSSGEIEIMFTLLGDANLDGQVNAEDFTPFSANVGKNGSWDDGDFNYDGTVNSEDFTPFSANLGKTATLAAAAGTLESADGIGLANVPEPGSPALLGVALIGLMPRRKRRS
jgi:fibronectin-binding autotransporter adhesin